MIITCPACATRYVVPETAIGSEGRTVRCANCKHSWFQEPAAEPDAAGNGGGSADDVRSAHALQESGPSQGQAGPARRNGDPGSAASRTDAVDKALAPDDASTSDKDRATPPPGQIPLSDGGGAGNMSNASSEPASHEPVGGTEPSIAAEDSYDYGEPVSSDYHPFREVDPAEGELAELPTIADTVGGTGEADRAEDDDARDEHGSRFAYSPPFPQRRGSSGIWTLTAALFATLAIVGILAVNHYGLPDWLPVRQPVWGVGDPQLDLDFPAQNQRTRTLPGGETIFEVRGSIANTGQTTTSVPDLKIAFIAARITDDNVTEGGGENLGTAAGRGQERHVGERVIVPAKDELAPGESINVTEAIADIPAEATDIEIGWAPN